MTKLRSWRTKTSRACKICWTRPKESCWRVEKPTLAWMLSSSQWRMKQDRNKLGLRAWSGSWRGLKITIKFWSRKTLALMNWCKTRYWQMFQFRETTLNYPLTSWRLRIELMKENLPSSWLTIAILWEISLKRKTWSSLNCFLRKREVSLTPTASIGQRKRVWQKKLTGTPSKGNSFCLSTWSTTYTSPKSSALVKSVLPTTITLSKPRFLPLLLQANNAFPQEPPTASLCKTRVIFSAGTPKVPSTKFKAFTIL